MRKLVERKAASIDTTSGSRKDQCVAAIDTFNEKTVRELLQSAASVSDDVAQLILDRRKEIVRAESLKVIDFSGYVMNVSDRVDEAECARKAEHYDLVDKHLPYVEDTIARIRHRAPAHCSFGTKKNAMVALGEIAKSIMSENIGYFGVEMIEKLQDAGSPLEQAIIDIFDEVKAED